jgi:hypothetical protein
MMAVRPLDTSRLLPLNGVGVIQLEKTGHLLTDDHFPAELDWASAALAWRNYVAGNQ